MRRIRSRYLSRGKRFDQSVGIEKSAPARIPVGQRDVTVLSRV
jgi:hypothetical protein